MGIGVGAGAALYDAFRRRAGRSGQYGQDLESPYAYDQRDTAQPDQPMGTIQTMARALPQPAATPVRPVMSEDALAIKSAAGDYSSEPTQGAIKMAAGQPVGARPVLSASRMPAPVNVDAAAYPGGDVTPPGMPAGVVTPQPVSVGRPPLPPVSASSPAYGRYEREAAALPTEKEYIEQHQPHGLLGRIGAGLKLGARTLVASGLNPIYAAEGLTIGLLDKNANAREQYRNSVEPRSIERQRRQLSMAGTELGMSNVQADNQRADETLDMTGEQHAATLGMQRAGLQDRERQWTERLQEKTLNDWMLRNAGRPIPKSIAASSGHPELEGYVPPQKVGNGPQPHFQYNQSTGETGIVEPDGNGGWKITRPSGQRMEATPERVSGADRQAAAEANAPNFDAAVKAKMDAWKQGHFASVGITPEVERQAAGYWYKEMDQGSDSPTRGQMVDEWRPPDAAAAKRIDEANKTLYARARDSVDRERERLGKAARGRRQLGPRASSSGTPKQRQPGQVVTYQGNRHKILSVNPDGSLELDPTPLQGPSEEEDGGRGSQKKKLSADQVKSYADANGWTPEQAASYLRSTGKYIVP